MCNVIWDNVAAMAWGSRAVHAGRAFGALVREPSCSSRALARMGKSNGGSAIRALKLPRGLLPRMRVLSVNYLSRSRRRGLGGRVACTTQEPGRSLPPVFIRC